MRALAGWIAWFGPLFGLWLGFVGAAPGSELVAGLGAAALGATAAAVVRHLGLLSYRLPFGAPLRLLARAWAIARDFAMLLGLLGPALRGRPPRGQFRVADADTGGDDPAGRGRRALAGWAGSLAPAT